MHPASADCAAEIKKAEAERSSALPAHKQLEAYERIMVRAKSALEEGKERRCLKLVTSAREKLG